MAATNDIVNKSHLDTGLLLSSLSLLCLGLVMVASASMPLSAERFDQPFFYLWRQSAFALVGVSLAALALWIPLRSWRALSVILLLLGAMSLILVVIPGIGHEVNGSYRWLRIGGIGIQPSEPMKLAMILYLAGYLVRRSEEVQVAFSGFFKPMLVLTLISSLILLEPDYGTTVVLFATVMGLLFLAGVPLKQFALWSAVVLVSLILLIVLAPYRLARLTSFMDPWADPFNRGFQLTQSLIAIGRGEVFGVGLGQSIQKITYLPEAHTDFVFAVFAEEMGLFGVVILLALFGVMITRIWRIAWQAEQLQRAYSAYTAYGIALLFALQTTMNLGVNMGLLPTKGLTLPLLSYGGSSLVVSCLAIGIVLRIDWENQRLLKKQTAQKLH